MKLEDIQKMWAVDAVIDETRLNTYSLQIPLLHSKYRNLLSHAKMGVAKIAADYDQLKHRKEQFYEHGPSKEDTHGWQLPPQGKIPKPQVAKYVSADPDLIKLGTQLALAQEKVDFLKDVLDTIGKLSFNISNAIRFLEWTSGGR